MFKRTKVCTGVLIALGSGLLVGAMPVYAQTTGTTATDQAKQPETITVTGSRLRRIDAESASPIQTIDRAQIETSGYVTIGSLLQNLPSIAGAATNPQVNNGGGDGASTISLRGLGDERTLVLLDGRRLGPSFDVNAIPLNMIDRVDILKQGAGATYGSDAIGGVVNIITRKDFTGFDVAYQRGESTKKDAKTDNVELTFGLAGDKGHAMVGLNYNKQGSVNAGNRKFSKNALYWYTYQGQVTVLTLGSSSTPQGRITIPNGTPGGTAENPSTPILLPNGQTAAATYGCGGVASAPGLTPTSTVVTRGGGAAGGSLNDYRCYNGATDAFDYQPFNLVLTPQERTSLFVDGAYNVNDSVEVFASVLHSYTTSGFTIAPLPMVANNDGFATSADNPFGMSFGAGGIAGSNFQTRIAGLSNRQSHVATTFDQLTGGARGAIGKTAWNWDAALTYQRNQVDTAVDGYIQQGLLQQALDSNLFDIFNITPDNPTGQASLDALQSISSGYQNKFVSTEKIAEVSVNGDLFKWSQGVAKAAFGVDYQKSDLTDDVDDLTVLLAPDFTSCGLSAETCSGDTTGSDSVKELYGEVFIPLLTDYPFVKALNLTLGTRYSDYDSFGSTSNSSIKLEYRPVNDLLFRGTWSQVFRAPTISDRFGAQLGNFPIFTDPCATLTGNEANFDRACEGVSAGNYEPDNSQILGLIKSNPDLQPEKGKVFTLGLVYDSSLVKGLSLAADYWHYRINGAITTLDPNTIANSCLNTGDDFMCGLIHRDPATGQVLNIEQLLANAGFFETDGIDVSAKYIFPLTPIGRFQLNGDAAWTRSFEYDLGDGVKQDASGTLDPTFGNFAKWRATMQLQWAYGPIGAQWTTRYIRGTSIPASAGANYGDGTVPVTILRQPGIVYNDVALSYTFEQTGTKVLVGLNNAFDKQPPLTYQFQLNGNVDVNTYDTIGRRWFARIQQSF
jgi:outer membrane receptor protein involved in Fe transport